MENNLVTVERLRSLFNYDQHIGVFTRRVAVGRHGRHKALHKAGTKQNFGYIVIAVDHRRYVAHRLAWLYVYGVWPSDDVDHINGDKSDNRIFNLRLATRAQNMQNVAKHKHNKSGAKGVSWMNTRSKWRAYIFVGYKQIHLGLFSSFNRAVEARKLAEQTYHSHAYGNG
jgi:hypothetical protein